MADEESIFLREVCDHHISGTLKVAPEHISPQVLEHMQKLDVEVLDRFAEKYRRTNGELGKKQYLIPYFISFHPGNTLDDAVDLALYLAKTGFVPDQVKDFYPTPGTRATCMHYTELDPFTKKKVYVAKSMEEKKMQRALHHFHKKENCTMVKKVLKKVGRKDEFFGKTAAYRKRE